MVYIELNGRLGNHLFQLAAALSLARKHNTRVAVVCHERYLLPKPDNCTIYQYIQQYKDTIFKDIPILTELPDSIKRFNQNGHSYAPIPYSDNIYLFGTFQSEKYFDPVTVKKQFSAPSSLKDNLYLKYGHILKMGVTSISVRRGDYLEVPHEFNITSINFFKKAINYIGKDSCFLIISDDIQWCKNQFKGDNYFFAENGTPLEDLYLLSFCKNNIISNSTFSWWGAWLNNNPAKIIIAPKPWYGKALSSIPTDDLIPESWIQIENRMSLLMRVKAFKIMSKKAIKKRIKKIINPGINRLSIRGNTLNSIKR